jgi:hypothetical protein
MPRFDIVFWKSLHLNIAGIIGYQSKSCCRVSSLILVPLVWPHINSSSFSLWSIGGHKPIVGTIHLYSSSVFLQRSSTDRELFLLNTVVQNALPRLILAHSQTHSRNPGPLLHLCLRCIFCARILLSNLACGSVVAFEAVVRLPLSF